MLFGIKEMKEFASGHEDPRVVSIWNRLNKSRRENASWCNKVVELEDLLRWRDAGIEPPKSSGKYLTIGVHGVVCSDAFDVDSGWEHKFMMWTHWRPLGPLPELGCDNMEGESERDKYAESVVVCMNIVRHMWANSRLSNFGYDSMTDEMKRAFNRVVGKPIGDRNT